MLGPIQHTPIPLEPARQQLTPPQATVPPPALPAAAQPLQQSDSGKDQFAGKDGEQANDADQERRRQQQHMEAVRELNSAWARLNALQQTARAALGEGDGVRARDAAVEAAGVASSIRDMASSFPGLSAGAIDVPAALDNARAGVGAALQVVNLAGSMPTHPIEDRIIINGARHQVVEAMAGVEAVAIEMTAPSAGDTARNQAHYDFRT